MKETSGIKAFKLMPDGTLETGGIGGSEKTIFKVGETYKVSGKPEFNRNGFHFYKPKNACFGIHLYGTWPDRKTVLHEIIAYGNVASDTEQCVCCKIKVGEKVKIKIDEHFNSGDYNTGEYNSGNYNSGYCNSGNCNWGSRNSGDHNCGSQNSGNFNSGKYNAGHFNLFRHSNDFYCFDKPCSPEIWSKAKLPKFLKFIPDWSLYYHESFQKAWETASKNDKELLEKLPNFDWGIFTHIAGIKKY